MGIFTSLSKKNITKITTKDFYFGSPEAEGENVSGSTLVDYFEDYLGVLNDLQKGHFIFIGRKGVGKSAIAKFIKDSADKEPDSHAVILRISDFHKENIIQNDEKINTSTLFEWLILINIVKLIVQSKAGMYTKEFEKLEKFLERNTGSIEIDKFETSEIFIRKGGEIRFEVLRHAFDGIFNNYFDSKTSKAPYFKLIAPLKEIVAKIISYDVIKEHEFWLLFDDLDIDYSVDNELSSNNVMELLRIARNYNNEIFNKGRAKILIFMREDMRNIIISKYNDSAKLVNSYGIHINWYSHELSKSNENYMPLKRLANKRIELNFQHHNISYNMSDPWSSLINNEYRYNKSSFKHVLDYTFYRPRDIITFLDVLSKDDYQYPIDNSTLWKILKKYITININEIKSELSIFFSEKEKDILFSIIFPYVVNNSNIRYEDIKKLLSKYDFQIELDKIIEILLNYDLLIYCDENHKLIINYRESDLESYDKEKLYIALHKCLYHYYK